jgi:hypothetical protein
MEIWREGAREGGLGWDGGQRKERELKCRKVAGAGGDPLVKLQELRGERGTWRLGRYVSAVQVWPAVFRRFDISSYQITPESRVTATLLQRNDDDDNNKSWFWQTDFAGSFR